VDARLRILVLVLAAASVALGIVLGVRMVDAFG
jgi:hypothetical protein